MPSGGGGAKVCENCGESQCQVAHKPATKGKYQPEITARIERLVVIRDEERKRLDEQRNKSAANDAAEGAQHNVRRNRNNNVVLQKSS